MNTPPNNKKRRIRMLGFGLVMSAALYVVFMRANPPREEAFAPADAPKEVILSKSEYGDAWPFRTIESGKVYCVEYAVVFRDDKDGQVYGLNGAAASYAKAKGYDWKSLEEEHIVGKDISFMLDAGNKLCK